MITLIDNDIILKMAKWDLMNELIGIAGGNLEKIFHLPTCIYALCSPNNQLKALKRCGNQTTIDRVRAFCDTTKTISQPKELRWLEMLNDIPAIDVGEVLIFSTGAENSDSFTFIGDKRSLCALAETKAAIKAFMALKGRVKCLEQIIAEMIGIHGCTSIGKKLRACPTADKTISIVMGSTGTEMQEAEIWKGLMSYYSCLYDKTARLLAPFPNLQGVILSEPHRDVEVLQTN